MPPLASIRRADHLKIRQDTMNSRTSLCGVVSYSCHDLCLARLRITLLLHYPYCPSGPPLNRHGSISQDRSPLQPRVEPERYYSFNWTKTIWVMSASPTVWWLNPYQRVEAADFAPVVRLPFKVLRKHRKLDWPYCRIQCNPSLCKNVRSKCQT